MSATPIFDQLCRELGDVTKPGGSVGVIDIEPAAAVEFEPGPAPNSAATAAEWSAPGERVA